MKEEQSIYVSGSRHFNEEDLNKMIELLDEGKKIHIGIEVIGHTKNNMEQEAYKEALEKHYENRLETTYMVGWCSYGYQYKLKSKED